jgi:hypothetical protein
MPDSITKPYLASIIKIAITLAIITAWVTLWISYSALPYSNADVSAYMHAQPRTMEPPAVAKAGWPFTVFYYPPTPLGNDIPPSGSGFPFALNTMIFFILFWTVLHFVPKRFFTYLFERAVVYSAFVVMFIGLFETILAFD